MHWFRNLSIKRKLRLVILLASTMALLLAAAAFVQYDVVSFRRVTARDLTVLGDIVGNNCTAALTFANPDDAAGALAGLKAQPHIVAACLYSKEGKLFAQYVRKGTTAQLPSVPGEEGHRFEADRLVLFRPIVLSNKRLGTIYLESDLEQLHARLRSYAGIVALVLLGSLLLTLVLSARLQRVISKPILALADTARIISDRKDYSVRAEKLSRDELGLLTDAFNEMLTQIQHREAALQTARDELEQRVEERTADVQRLASIVEFSDDAIISLTLDGTILSWNSGAEGIYGYSAEEAIGNQIATPDQPTEVPQILERIKRGEHAEHLETVHVRKDGTKLNVSLTVSPIHDESGGVTSAAIIARDVTEARRTAEALRRNEERTRRIIETAHDAFVCMDSAGLIVDWNPQAETTFGWRRQEALGKPLVNLIIPTQYREAHLQGLQRFLKTGEGPVLNKLIEISALHRDGHEFPVELSISPARLGDAHIFNAFVHDITERKRSEEELRQSEERFRLMVAGVKDYAILRLDPEGRVVSWNSGAERIKGYRAEEIIGQHFSRFYTEEDLKQDKPARILKLAEEQGRCEDEGWRVRKDGSRFWANVVITSLRDEAGELRGFVKVTRDTTERRQAEKDLQKTAAELARSNAELEQFAYAASHDLQEPLRMVGSYTELLAKRYRGKLDKDADDFIGFAVDGAMRMQTLINDLLAYSRVGTRGKPFQPTDSSALLDRALANLQFAIAESHAEVTRDPLPTVLVDPTQLTQLFQNLIGNAVKFRREKAPHIHVSAARNEKEWLFSVRDNGIGIAPEYRERIFLLFQRLHSRAEYPGTGIGLAICKKIVDRHGGRIWVESEPDHGSTFHFTIPDKGEQTS